MLQNVANYNWSRETPLVQQRQMGPFMDGWNSCGENRESGIINPLKWALPLRKGK